MDNFSNIGFTKAACIAAFCVVALATQTSAQTINATLHITLDCWGEETGYTLKDWGGTTISSAAAGDYANSFPGGSTVVTAPIPLIVDDCYIFTYVDMGGDGVVGSIWEGCEADGSFALIAETGDTLVASDNEDFTWSLLRVFCVKEGCTDPDALNYNSSANVSDGSCILPEPIANFSFAEDQRSCEYATYEFKNESSFGVDYYWTFENGIPEFSIEENPVVQFPVGSSPIVKLHVENATADANYETELDIPASEVGSTVTFQLEPDCWAHELAWNLYDSGGNLIRSRAFGDYEGSFPSNQVLIEESFCLSNGCYTFELLDEYGDGLEGDMYDTCDHDGTYRFLDHKGELILEFTGPTDWGFVKTEDFCSNVVYVWNGLLGTNWNTPGNWEDGIVPPDFADVYINSLGTPLVLELDVVVNNITIGPNSTLEFLANSNKIDLHGDLTNFGTIDNYKGLIVAKGNTTQFIKGPMIPTFYRFRMNTTGKVVLLTDVNFSGALIPNNGDIYFNDNEVSLVSGISYQGSIGEIRTNASVNGNITYYRYYPAGAPSWRMLSTPIVDATFEQWNDDFATTGFTGSDYPNYPSAAEPWSNIRTYNETFTNGVEADRHFGFESIDNIANPIDNQIGYFVYFVPSPTMIDAKGQFFQGEYVPKLSYSPSDSGLTSDGWNLIANPYPSAIDWDATLDSRVGMDNAIYAYDPNLKQYSAYVGGVSTGMLTNQIASGQAFWVKTNMDAAEVTFREDDKVNGMGIHMKEINSSTRALIHVDLTTPSTLDKCIIGFNTSAQLGFDPNLDAYKFYSSDANLPALAALTDDGAIEMAISMNPLPEGAEEIDLKINPGNKQELTLTNSMVDSFDGNFCFLLLDKELDTTVPFNQDDSYTFSVTDVETTQNRFSVIVQALAHAEIIPESCPNAEDGMVSVNGFGEAPWTFTWKDEMGTIIQESSDLYAADVATDLSPGFYEIKVENLQDQCKSASIVVEVPKSEHLELSVQAITASCNDNSKAGIQIDIDERFEWELTIEDEHGKFSRQLTGITSDTLLTGLDIATYSVRAISSCGNGMVIGNINIADPNQPIGTLSTDQPGNETYVGLPIQLRYNSEEKVDLEWTLENGNRSNEEFPIFTFTVAGEFEIEASISNEYCKSVEKITVKVNESLANQLDQKDSDLEESADKSGIELSVIENVLWMNFDAALNGPVMFTVFNNGGQTVLEETQLANDMQNHQLDLGSLTPGIYYLNVNDANGLLFSEKFIQTN